MMRHRGLHVAGLALTVVLVWGFLCPDAGFAALGAIKGRVITEDKEPLVGAKVTLRDTRRGGVRDQETKKKGNFYFGGLEATAMEYEITIEAEGYNIKTIYEKAVVGDPKLITIILSEIETRTTQQTLMDVAQPEKVEGEDKLAPEVRAAMAAGREMLADRQFDAAMEKFQEALAADPTFIEAKIEMGNSLYFAGKLDEAEKIHREVASTTDASAWRSKYALGLIRLTQEKYGEAETFFNEVLSTQPQNAGAHYSLAICMMKTERLDEALNEMTRATTYMPGLAEAYYFMGVMYEKKGEPAMAKTQFQKLIEVRPEGAEKLLFNLAAEFIKNANDVDGKDALIQAVDIKPDYAKAHRELGYIYFRQGETTKAREHFEKYLEYEPAASDAAVIKDTVKYLKELG